jgi:hypothetical protein
MSLLENESKTSLFDIFFNIYAPSHSHVFSLTGHYTSGTTPSPLARIKPLYAPVANRPFFKNTKITKRTQFKNRITRHPRQPRRTT